MAMAFGLIVFQLSYLDKVPFGVSSGAVCLLEVLNIYFVTQNGKTQY